MARPLEWVMDSWVNEFRRRNEWDVEPRLELLIDYGALRGIRGIELVHSGAWPDAHPADTLRTLTRAVRRVGTVPIPPDDVKIAGIGLMTEGYAIIGDSRPVEHWESHSIGDDPAGVEVVTAIAIDFDGKAYGSSYIRGESTATSMTADDAKIDGRMVALLHDLLIAITP